MEKLILLGGGGHCKACIDVIEQEGKYEIAGILDKIDHVGDTVLGYKIIGTDNDIERLSSEGYSFLITIGQIDTAAMRRKLFDLLCKNSAKMATVISPRAYVSKHSSLGKGTIIMHDSLVNASVLIGENCIINTKALIEHDVCIKSFCHISTGAVVNGGATIEEGSFFGSNAVCREGVIVPKESFVKAGSIYKRGRWNLE